MLYAPPCPSSSPLYLVIHLSEFKPCPTVHILNLVTLVGSSFIFTSCLINRHCFPVFFVAIVVFAIIEVCAHTRMQRYDNLVLQLSISAWVTARYNSRHDFLSTALRDRVRFLLFCSIWTTFLSPFFPVLLLLGSVEVLTSVAAHLVLFVLFIIPLILLMIRSTSACSFRGYSGSQGQLLSQKVLEEGLIAGT